jgi:hypothetical protein
MVKIMMVVRGGPTYRASLGSRPRSPLASTTSTPSVLWPAIASVEVQVRCRSDDGRLKKLSSLFYAGPYGCFSLWRTAHFVPSSHHALEVEPHPHRTLQIGQSKFFPTTVLCSTSIARRRCSNLQPSTDGAAAALHSLRYASGQCQARSERRGRPYVRGYGRVAEAPSWRAPKSGRDEDDAGSWWMGEEMPLGKRWSWSQQCV